MSHDIETDFALELEALSLIDQLRKERESAIEARRQNLPKNVPNLRKAFANNKNVKSDLKKSSTFVKKIKSINAEGLQQCLRDADTLNLTLYISEIVNAILATAYKATDAAYVVKLCLSLHQKYEEFTEPLITGLKTSLLSPPNEEDGEASKKKRIQIRLIIELYQAGLFNDDEFFAHLLRNILGKRPAGQNASSAKPVMDLQGLSTFVKYGYETFFGFVPRKVVEVVTRGGKAQSDIPVKLYASAKVSGDMKMLITDAYEGLCSDLVKAHADFRARESRCEKDRLIHGTLSEQKQQELEMAKRLYEKLLSVVSSIAECTGDKIPELKIEKEEEEGPSKLSVWENASANQGGEDSSAAGGLYGDPETRSFYEDLPDLLSLVPLSVLGFTPEQAAAIRAEWSNKTTESEDEQVIDDKLGEDAIAEAAEGEAFLEDDDKEVNQEITNSGEAAEAEVVTASTSTSIKAAAPEDGDESRASKLQILLTEKLPECVNKAKTDEFCVSFCYLNTKGARKQLVQALGRVPRGRGELTIHYARIVASLGRLFPDIIPPILDQLRKEFYGILKTKKQLHVENKIRNVRYQSELVKFRVAPPIVAFRMIKALLADFTPHHVQLLATLMETCGRFLYLLSYAQEAMNGFLDTMMRLRRARHLDLHHQTLIESAYFSVKPPERKAGKQKKERTVVQQYVWYLITERLDDPAVSVDYVLKSLRRLPWQNAEEKIVENVVKASFKVARTKYVLIPNLADCLSGLLKYYPNLVIQVVDRVLEEVQRALDSPYKREMQRILGLTRLLGELYNFTAITSSVVFSFLYHLINFGHDVPSSESALDSNNPQQRGSMLGEMIVKRFDPRIPSEVDPPNDLFRAQVICEMLQTVGSYFVSGAVKERMVRFVTYFQRYLLTKQFIPMHVEFTILDTFDYLEEQARAATHEGHRKHSKMAQSISIIFPRYDNLDAVQKVIDDWEAQMGGREAAGGAADDEDDEKEGEGDADEAPHRRAGGGEADQENDHGEEEDDGEDDSEESGDDEDEEDDSGEEEDEEESEEDISEREAAKMLEKLRIAEEDEDFDRAFKAVMQESISNVANRNQDINRMVIPAVLPKPKNTFSMTESEEENDEDAFEENHHKHKSKKIAFKLLSRDTRGRVETRQLLVPEQNPMAVKLVKAEEELRIEKEKLKQRVLMINSMQGEMEGEDDDEIYLAASFSGNTPSLPPAGLSIASSTSSSKSFGHGGSGRAQGGRGGYGHSGKYSFHGRGDDSKKTHDTLDLDGFLAEANAAEIRRLTGRGSGTSGKNN